MTITRGTGPTPGDPPTPLAGTANHPREERRREQQPLISTAGGADDQFHKGCYPASGNNKGANIRREGPATTQCKKLGERRQPATPSAAPDTPAAPPQGPNPHTPEGGQERRQRPPQEAGGADATESKPEEVAVTHIHRVNHEIRAVQSPPMHRMAQLVDAVAQTFQTDVHDIRLVHTIPRAVPNSNANQVIITELDGDREEGNVGEVYLMEVQRHEHHVHRMRRAFIGPEDAVTREEFLRSHNMDIYCRAIVSNRCLLYVNGRLWQAQDREPRYIHRADVIQLLIPPRDDSDQPQTATQGVNVSPQLGDATPHGPPARWTATIDGASSTSSRGGQLTHFFANGGQRASEDAMQINETENLRLQAARAFNVMEHQIAQCFHIPLESETKVALVEFEGQRTHTERHHVLTLAETTYVTEGEVQHVCCHALLLPDTVTMRDLVTHVDFEDHWNGNMDNVLSIHIDDQAWADHRTHHQIGAGAVVYTTINIEQTSHTAHPSPRRRRLHLESHLSENPQLRAIVDFTKTQEVWAAICQCPLPPRLQPPLPIKWHPATQARSEATYVWDWAWGTPDEIHFYTDGSARTKTKAQAGAAVIMLVEQGGELYYEGMWALTLNQEANATEAEKAAITLALLLAHKLDAEWHRQHRYHFHYDNLTAGHTAAGYWEAKKNPEISMLNRALVHASSRRTTGPPHGGVT